MTDEKQEFDELPELPEMSELPDLPELGELGELEVEPEVPVTTATASPLRRDEPSAEPAARGEALLQEEPSAPAALPAPESAPKAPLPSGETPPLRELDKAPRHLRMAALIVAAGTLLPFMGPGTGAVAGVWFSVGAKIIALAAAWLWLQQVLHDFGPQASGLVGNLAGLHLGKKKKEGEEEKSKRSRRQEQAVAKLEHPFPTGLHLVSILLLAGGVVLSLSDERSAMFGPLGTAEMLMFSWAAFTWVHIARYERWGGFNPLFPLMFLGMFFAGAARVMAGATAGDGMAGIWRLASGLGGAVVTVGGGLAAYTIVEAMMEAKKEGARKKAEALEARRAARKNRKS